MKQGAVIVDLAVEQGGNVEGSEADKIVNAMPKLGSGERFEYTSWAMLKTPFGTMRGTYFMSRPNGEMFEAKIGEFALTQPHALH